MPPPSTSVPKHSGIGAAWDSFVRTLFQVDETRLSPLRKGLLFAVRLGWLVVAAFFRDHLQLRAAALAFITILAFVPAGAVFQASSLSFAYPVTWLSVLYSPPMWSPCMFIVNT